MNKGSDHISTELYKLAEILNSDDNLKSIAEKITNIYEVYQRQYNKLEFGEYWLNAYCVGLGRYVDESGLDYRNNLHVKIINQLNVLVPLAANNLRQHTPIYLKRSCGLHEDGACIIAPLGPHAVITQPKRHLRKQLILQPWEAACFTSIPIPIILPVKSKIQRIINSKGDAANARWWKLDHHLPNSRKAWREEYAVLKMWNNNTHYIDHELEQDTPVWLGQAASQKVSWQDEKETKIDEMCILEGGSAQILLDPSYLPTPVDLHKRLKNTMWR